MQVMPSRKARPVRSGLYTFHKVYQTCKREEKRLARQTADTAAQTAQDKRRAEITLAPTRKEWQV